MLCQRLSESIGLLLRRPESAFAIRPIDGTLELLLEERYNDKVFGTNSSNGIETRF